MRPVYMRPTTIYDAAHESPPLRAYAVEACVLKEEILHDPRGVTAGGLALTAGYIVESSGFGTADLLQAITWHVDLRYDSPVARASFQPDDHQGRDELVAPHESAREVADVTPASALAVAIGVAVADSMCTTLI